MAAAVTGSAGAQSYPPPIGNCVLVPTTSNPPANTPVQVVLTWSDTAGNPVVNAPVSVQVGGQPGSGASVTPPNGVTGPAGTFTFTFNTGNGSGIVTLTASCGGEVATQVQVPVGQAPLPPRSGTGGDAGVAAVAGGAASVFLSVGALAAAMMIRRRTAGR